MSLWRPSNPAQAIAAVIVFVVAAVAATIAGFALGGPWVGLAAGGIIIAVILNIVR